MKQKLIVLAGLLMPVAAWAQVEFGGASSSDCEYGTSGTLFGLLCRFGQLLNSVVPVLIALAVLYFVWGVVQYVVASDEEAKKTGRNRIIFGIIGLVVIIGLWGLVNLLRNTFDLRNEGEFDLPTVPVIIEE